jgi:excisionase family DNA binding protein
MAEPRSQSPDNIDPGPTRFESPQPLQVGSSHPPAKLAAPAGSIEATAVAASKPLTTRYRPSAATSEPAHPEAAGQAGLSTHHVPAWAREGALSPHANGFRATDARGGAGATVQPVGARRSSAMARLMTVQECAETLNVAEKTIRRLIRRGEIAAVHIGRSIRVRPSELERLIGVGDN